MKYKEAVTSPQADAGKRAPGARSDKAGGSIDSRYQTKVVNRLPGRGGEELLVFSMVPEF